MKKILLASLLSVLSVGANAQATSNFSSTTNLQSRCVLSAQNMSFGELNVVTTATAFASGGINILCSKGVSYAITPTGGYEDSNIHIMKGTGTNKDGVLVRLVKEDQTTYWKNIAGGKLEGVGNATEVNYPISARFLRVSPVKTFDATATNTSNFEAKPDNYTATITAVVTY